MVEQRYYGSAEFREAAANAVDNWRVHQFIDGPGGTFRIVGAEAATGTRYVVTVTDLGENGHLIDGGRLCVAVTEPWQTSAMMSPGYTTAEYIAEKLVPRQKYREDRLHGGDWAALMLTIGDASRGLIQPDVSPLTGRVSL